MELGKLRWAQAQEGKPQLGFFVSEAHAGEKWGLLSQEQVFYVSQRTKENCNKNHSWSPRIMPKKKGGNSTAK